MAGMRRGQRLPIGAGERQSIDIGRQPLLAAGGREQARILGLAPMPIQTMLPKGLVECAAMCFLGIRQRAVNVEYQRL